MFYHMAVSIRFLQNAQFCVLIETFLSTRHRVPYGTECVGAFTHILYKISDRKKQVFGTLVSAFSMIFHRSHTMTIYSNSNFRMAI